MVTDEDSDTDEDPLPPTLERVIQRAFCLSAVVCRAFIDEYPEDEECRTRNTEILPWLREMGAEAELEPWEAHALSLPLGQMENQTRVNGTWASEGLAVLAWALDLYDMPPHDESLDPMEVTSALDFLQPEAISLFEEAGFRPDEEIEAGVDCALAIHWRVREFSLNKSPLDFATFAKTAWFGPLNIEGLKLVELDLSIGGEPISRATASALSAQASIALERHRAFNWLQGSPELYSEVDVST